MPKETNTSVVVRTEMLKKMEMIDEQLSKVKALSESPYKTNGEFRFNPAYTANAPIYVHKCSDLKLLLSILSYLTGQSNNYKFAAEEIAGLTTYPAFDWLNFGYDAWKHDLLVRISHVTQFEKINKLKKAKATLEQFMSEEDRLAIALKEIDSLI